MSAQARVVLNITPKIRAAILERVDELAEQLADAFTLASVPRTYIVDAADMQGTGDLLVTVHPDDDGIEVAPRLDETRWGAPLPVRRAD